MPSYIIKKLRQGLDKQFKKGLNGSRILLLGIAYKKDVDDMRESPSVIMYEKLTHLGAAVDYHDPVIPEIQHLREHPSVAGLKSVPLTPESAASYDAVVICTEHTDVDYAMLLKHAKLIVDSRNAMSHHNLTGSHVIKA